MICVAPSASGAGPRLSNERSDGSWVGPVGGASLPWLRPIRRQTSANVRAQLVLSVPSSITANDNVWLSAVATAGASLLLIIRR
jgi:hypothetical protein